MTIDPDGPTMRLESVTVRSALWEESFCRRCLDAAACRGQGGDQATDIASCEVMYASRLGRSSPDKDLTAAITTLCLWRNTPGVEAVQGLRKLSQLAPNDGDIRGLLARWLVATLDGARHRP